MRNDQPLPRRSPLEPRSELPREGVGRGAGLPGGGAGRAPSLGRSYFGGGDAGRAPSLGRSYFGGGDEGRAPSRGRS